MKTLEHDSVMEKLSLQTSISTVKTENPIKPKASKLDQLYRQKIRNKHRELHKMALANAKVVLGKLKKIILKANTFLRGIN